MLQYEQAKQPEKVQDLMGYQTLIVEACIKFGSDAWLGYDCCFWQMVAASPNTPWAMIDSTLWNMAFTGQAKAQWCIYCFSLKHPYEECNWAPASHTSLVHSSANMRVPRRTANSQVCISWNHIITLGQGTLLAKIALLWALLCSFQFIQLTVTY